MGEDAGPQRSLLHGSFSSPVLTPCVVFSTLGITVDKFGLIYFVDGTMIRRVDQNGIISTLLGSNDLTSARPLSCDSVMDISQVRRLCVLRPRVPRVLPVICHPASRMTTPTWFMACLTSVWLESGLRGQ